jgi:hypothetical protein
MDYTTDLYLKKIKYTMENVIAPAIDDDFARGQVFAVLNILEGLGKKIEYKQDLINTEIKVSAGVLLKLAPALVEASVKLSDELTDFSKALKNDGPGADLLYRNKLDEMLSQAINLFFQNRNKLDGDKKTSLDEAIRESITKIATRDIGLMATPNFDKISGKKQD